MSPLRTLLKKEFTDVLRDKRTLMLTIGIPIVLYPVMFMAMGAMMTVGLERLKNEELTVAITNDDGAAMMSSRPAPAHTTFKRMTRAEAEPLLREQKLAAIIDAAPDAGLALAADQQASVTIVYTKRFDTSAEALGRVKPVLEAVNDQYLVSRLVKRELEPAFAKPLKTESYDLDFQRDLGPLIASKLLPITLLMMLLVGAVYPAIDLIAGEKERGTFETLLVAAVRPVDVLMAKFATITTLSIVSTIINLFAMSLTFGVGFTLDDRVSMSFHFTTWQLTVMAASLLPAALLMSGLSMAVASVARNHKEGQTLVTPLVLAATAPVMLSQMPGLELTSATAMVPLLNVALLVKSLVLDTAKPLPVVLTITSVLACSLGALKLAAMAFQSETFRFGSSLTLQEWLRQRFKRA